MDERRSRRSSAASMFSPNDTIVAVATPPGRGGLGVLRLSGPEAARIVTSLFDGQTVLQPRHATLARIAGLDSAIVTFFQAPHSYTGEDVVEMSLHGNPLLLARVAAACAAAGARLAGRGEFTLRAFLNGRIDLVQAEAVADLIAAQTPLQARVAFEQLEGSLTRRIEGIDARLLEVVLRLEASLDFPDEGYRFIEPADASASISAILQDLSELAREGHRGRLIREGCTVAISGRPNVGKSSIFNNLAGSDRAIVTPEPGTTRDLVTGVVDIGGFPVTLVDTAGLRDSSDLAETEGVRRARQSLRDADLLIVVLDRSERLRQADHDLLRDTEGRPRIVALNKADCPAVWDSAELHLPRSDRAVDTSATLGTGIDHLQGAILARLGTIDPAEPAVMTNVRQLSLVERARQALLRATGVAAPGSHEELVLADLHEARAALEEVTGKRSSEDLLHEIFGRFCIGK